MEWINDLATLGFAIHVAGTGCVAYALWHIWFASTSDDYHGPSSMSETAASQRISLSAWISFLVMLVGLSIVGVRLTDALLGWMPYSWGDETADGWKSTREYLTYAVGGLFGFAGLAIPIGASKRRLSRHHKELLNEWETRRNHHFRSYHDALVHTSIRHLEAELERLDRADEQSKIDDARLQEERARERQEERDASARRIRETNERWVARERRLAFLRELTEDELDLLWTHRPLISWTEPMHSMSPEEQRVYWGNHLELTSWPIPKSIVERALKK